MRYIDFSTPKSVMVSISFEVFISVDYVWCEIMLGQMEVGILIMLLSSGEGEDENSGKQNIMQV